MDPRRTFRSDTPLGDVISSEDGEFRIQLLLPFSPGSYKMLT